MLLFHKRDLLVVLTKSGDTVQFAKPIKDILKYQHGKWVRITEESIIG